MMSRSPPSPPRTSRCGLAASVGSTWFAGAVPNYRAAALVRAGDPDRAMTEVLATCAAPAPGARRERRQRDPQLGRPARSARPAALGAPLVVWLDAHDGGIVGTPGMRQRVAELRDRPS